MAPVDPVIPSDLPVDIAVKKIDKKEQIEKKKEGIIGKEILFTNYLNPEIIGGNISNEPLEL